MDRQRLAEARADNGPDMHSGAFVEVGTRVFLDELPRNATGKVLKRELAGWDTEDDQQHDQQQQKDGEGPA